VLLATRSIRLIVQFSRPRAIEIWRALRSITLSPLRLQPLLARFSGALGDAALCAVPSKRGAKEM
jgi:hypothetical protein